MVNHRRTLYATSDRIWNETHEGLSRITAGSKGEGFAAYCESDTDFLCIHKYKLCTLSCDKQELADTENLTLFQMLTDACAPGHYKLKLTKRGSFPLSTSLSEALLTLDTAEPLVSSDMYAKSLNKQIAAYIESGSISKNNSGPAVPQTLGGLHHDHVYAFRCTSQEMILSEWISRPRKFSWPSSDLIKDVMNQEAQLVPVGSKISDCRDLEWRICFIPGEMKLTHGLNQTQYKIYILLKMINKSILKPICSEMSSYIMKNIVYWLVEEYPDEMFTLDTLFDTLMIALTFLRHAIKDNCCPYYMLPDRNLLSGPLSPMDIENLTSILDTLKNEGPSLFLRCHKLKDALTTPTTEIAIKGSNKDKLEKTLLELQLFKCSFKFRPKSTWQEKDKQLYATEGYMSIVIRVRDLAWPEWRDY